MSIPFLNGLTINRDEIPEYPEFKKKFTERLDKSICDIILQSNNPVFTPEMKSCFRNNVVNHIKNNELKTEWRPNYGIGRYHPKGNISLTPISKYIKHTIYSHMEYIDIDMVRSHSSIAVEINKTLPKEQQLNLSAVQNFINNRDAICDKCIRLWSLDNEDNKLTRDDVKYLFNLTIYGGSFNTWINKYLCGDPLYNRKGKLIHYDRLCQEYEDFQEQIKIFGRAIFRANDELDIYLTDKKIEVGKMCEGETTFSKKSRVVSFFYQAIENHIVYECFLYLVKKNIIEKSETTYYATLEFDGICIPYPPVLFDEAKILKKMNKRIKKETGLDVKMDWKKYKSDTIQQDIIEARRNGSNNEESEKKVENNEITQEQLSSKDYNTHKIEFEKTACKIEDLGFYIKKIEYGNEMSYIIKKKHELVASYEHRHFFDVKKNKRVNFINTWVKDDNILLYKNVDTFPNQNDCDEYIFNLWVPFLWERKAKPYTPNEKGLQFWLNHLKILCGRQEDVYEYFLKWIAHVIQFPEIKTGKMPIFVSKEGAGKGSFIKFLEKLLGDNKIFSTENTEEVWGQFNPCMKDALIVCLDDLRDEKTNKLFVDIKKFITDARVRVADKNDKAVQLRSYHRFVLLCNPNQQNIIKFKDEARRYFVIRCSDELINPDGGDEQKNAYFDTLNDIMLKNTDILQTCYAYFKQLPVKKNFSSHKMPKSSLHADIEEKNRKWQSHFWEYFAQHIYGKGERGKPLPQGTFRVKTGDNKSYSTLFPWVDRAKLRILEIAPDNIYQVFQMFFEDGLYPFEKLTNKKFGEEMKGDGFGPMIEQGEKKTNWNEKIINLTELYEKFDIGDITENEVKVNELEDEEEEEEEEETEDVNVNEIEEETRQMKITRCDEFEPNDWKSYIAFDEIVNEPKADEYLSEEDSGDEFPDEYWLSDDDDDDDDDVEKVKVVEEAEEEEEVEQEVEEQEEEQDVCEMTINGINYYVANEKNSAIYEIDEKEDVGPQIGNLVDGVPIFFQKNR